MWIFFFLAGAGLVRAGSGAPVFQDEDCEQVDLVAREFMSLERAGARWQGGNSDCIPKLKLKTWKTEKIKALPDPSLADPDYVIPASRKIDVKSKRTPDDRIIVKFSYVGRKAGREVSVQDELELKLNFGKARASKGCAMLFKQPRYLVMNAGCAED